MLTLQQHVEAESARWAAAQGSKISYYEESLASTSTTDSVFSSPAHIHSKYHTRTLSRRSSTSSFATEFEPEPQHQQPFVVPRDFNGAPITVYASLEAAVAAAAQSDSVWMVHSQQGGGGGGGGGDAAVGVVGVGVGVGAGAGAGAEQPRILVSAGKLYENEEDDDEIVYE
ncbi:hypothetical protein F4808DRAFT_12532 [Astrocystis sublimbata]|nr:hypothetical protein F4808DRAFT_12532 [Astrocystis sublimbata]